MQQHPPQVFGKAIAALGVQPRGGGRGVPEPLLILGQAIALQHDAVALGILADQQELPQVGHQHQAIQVPVAGHLIARRDGGGVRGGPLDLHHAAGGQQAGQRVRRALTRQLIGGEQCPIGQPSPGATGVDDALHARPQVAAHLVEQGGQGGVVGGLLHARAGEMDRAQVPGVRLQWRHDRSFLSHSGLSAPPAAMIPCCACSGATRAWGPRAPPNVWRGGASTRGGCLPRGRGRPQGDAPTGDVGSIQGTAGCGAAPLAREQSQAGDAGAHKGTPLQAVLGVSRNNRNIRPRSPSCPAPAIHQQRA